MSRAYDLHLTIYRHNTDKAASIKKAVREVWPFERFERGMDDMGNSTALCSRGEDSLNATRTKLDVINEIVLAVEKANGGNCNVELEFVELDKSDESCS